MPMSYILYTFFQCVFFLFLIYKSSPHSKEFGPFYFICYKHFQEHEASFVCFKDSLTKNKDQVDAGKVVNWYNL